MKSLSTISHTHTPIFRVVRSNWADPLDSSFSTKAPDNRWNDATFEALYCCCSEGVARAVARDVLEFAGVELDELQPSAQPQLVEIAWVGNVADVASAEGIEAAGLPAEYPGGTPKTETRRRAAAWHDARVEGVVCRSSSLQRLGFTAWTGAHEPWSGLAIFTANALEKPSLLAKRPDLAWYSP